MGDSNAAHWKAAQEGKHGYRRPDAVPTTQHGVALPPNGVALPPMTAVPAPVLTGDGLDIPAFLQRRPQLADRLAA